VLTALRRPQPPPRLCVFGLDPDACVDRLHRASVGLDHARVDRGDARVAGVAEPIAIRVELRGVRHEGAVVVFVWHLVAIVVTVTGVALSVGVGVALVCVGVEPWLPAGGEGVSD
jgi:hypothetical protein